MAKFLDPKTMKPVEVFKLMLSFIVPRPIGWISTISQDGVSNLAPFSFFNMVSNNPAVLAFSPAISRDLKRKDSLENVKQTKGFVHNVMTRKIAERMVQTSYEYPSGVSEFEKVGFSSLPSKFVKAPRVKEALINVECELNQILSFGDKPGNGQLIFGNVVAIHINDESILAEDGCVRAESLSVVARMGRAEYMEFGNVITISRPKSG